MYNTVHRMLCYPEEASIYLIDEVMMILSID